MERDSFLLISLLCGLQAAEVANLYNMPAKLRNTYPLKL